MNIYTRSHSGNTFEPGISANTAYVPGYARAKGLPPSGLIVTLKRGVSAAPHSQVRTRIASRPAKMRGEESSCTVRKGSREGVLEEKLSADIPVACQVEVLQRKSDCDGRGSLKQVYCMLLSRALTLAYSCPPSRFGHLDAGVPASTNSLLRLTPKSLTRHRRLSTLG